MTEKEKKIRELEDQNAEWAKEILLNETAIYETEKELSSIDTELLSDQRIQSNIQFLRLLIERIESKNEIYKEIIYNNDLEINRLENEKD